ncbi:MAG: hypothetical protein JXA23_09265 [Bacteroidales bacterium]|nr:hypothetical protein [Bacteroidales bacterium]
MKKMACIVILSVLTGSGFLFSQDDKPIDASKPTNFYSLVDNTLEFISRGEGGNLFGYRGKLVYAPSEAHLLLGELPVHYNDQTGKFGLGDIRIRYFWLPYKNYTRFVGAFGPSLDIIVPTGRIKNGLGTGRWFISPGISAGLMFNEYFQIFPVLSYQYMSKPGNPEYALSDQAFHGMSLQFIIALAISEKAFFNLTPMFNWNDFNDINSLVFATEVLFGYQVLPKGQISAYYNGNFSSNTHQLSVGYTFFF